MVETCHSRLATAALAGYARPRFRGEIWENAAGVGMGRGFANEGKPFDINSACYLKEPQREIRTRPYGKFVFKCAVQMLKTFGTIEQPAGYFIEHDPGDMTIYLPADSSAFDQAKARLMPYLKAIPGVGKIIEVAETANRFDITTAEFYLPNMALRVWPLNETTTQRITLRYVMISDAFLSGRTGLIDQALRRTTQHNTNSLKDYKVIIESQGGEAGDDFDVQWDSTDQRMLHVRCPFCGTGQPFVWHRERGSDFVAVPPKEIPSLDHAAWVNHHQPILMSPERRHAGMKRGDEALIRREDGKYNETEIQRHSHYECYHCGSRWLDTPAIRKAVDESNYYVPANPDAVWENVGWSWPSWAGQRLPWGGEYNMLGYLRAKKQADDYGNYEPLKQWYQKSAAQSWDKQALLRRALVIEPGSYETDPDKRPFGEDFHCMQMTVDCGKALDAGPDEARIGTFWFVVRAWDKRGNSQQMARGFVDSWELLDAQRRYWKVPCSRTFVDCAWMPSQVEAAAVRHFELVPPEGLVRMPACWRLIEGAGLNRNLTNKGRKVPYISHPLPGQPRTAHDRAGRLWRMTPWKVTWSNGAFEDQLNSILTKQTQVKFDYLSKAQLVIVDKDLQPSEALLRQTLERETEHRTYENQLNSRYWDGKKWADYAKQQRPTEYRDCELFQLVGVAGDGLLGHVGLMEETKAE